MADALVALSDGDHIQFRLDDLDGGYQYVRFRHHQKLLQLPYFCCQRSGNRVYTPIC